MRVRRQQGADGSVVVELLDVDGEPVEVVSGFLRFLAARDCSPNTLESYAYDLRHLWRFFDGSGLSWDRFGPPDSIALLEHLRSVPSRRPRRRMTLSVVTVDSDGPATKLAASTVNRILAATSSFYEYAILSGKLDRANPLEMRPDPALARVADRHRPFVGRASRQLPIRRAVRVKTVQRLPRPLSDDQVDALLGELRGLRDKAIVLLMLHGGLRPGEVLGLHLEDLAYGRRRMLVRFRDDHPEGARSKSRYERVVDLHEAQTLAAVSAYVMNERPADVESRLLFLIGGQGARRAEALSDDGLVRMFFRARTRAGIREPWVTPHALRHTHATAMWEGGWGELTLFAAGQLGILEPAAALGIDLGTAKLVEDAIALGFNPASARQAMHWSVTRIALHTGVFDIAAIAEDHIAEALQAIRFFADRPDLESFHPSRSRFLDGAAKGWITHLHQLQVVLFHRG